MMKSRRIISVLLGCMLLVGSTVIHPSVTKASTNKVIMAYYPYWYLNYKSDKIQFDKLTHVNHSFVQPETDGSITIPTGFLEPLLITRAHAANVKVLLSVGGAITDADANFRALAASSTARTNFANNLESFVRTNGYDGVDIDWEFPSNSTDRTNFNLLLQAINDKFNSSASPAPSWMITVAVSGNPNVGQWTDYSTVKGLVDLVNIMSYDMHGPWATQAGHNAPLYENPIQDSEFSTEQMIDYIVTTRGVPESKVVMGIPFFGLSYPNAEDLYDSDVSSGTWNTYTDVAYMACNDWTKYWDADSMVPYLRKDVGTGVISYEDAISVDAKVEYALDYRDLAGVFTWELTQDDIYGNHPLMDAMYSAYVNYTGGSSSQNLALNKAVTTLYSGTKLGCVTDGFMESNQYANLIHGGLDWIQVDLGVSQPINQVKLWHYFTGGLTYHDVIVQVSDSATFSSGVTTVYNNDTDNSAGLGIGTDSEYLETSSGKSMTFPTVNARYIRLWSNGNNVNTLNHYVEVEAYNNPNLALAKTVTTKYGGTDLSYSVDGNKNTSQYANLTHGDLDWIQLDLSRVTDMNTLKLWHYYADGRTYKDIVVQVSNSSTFSSGVTTLFNNDTNNSAGLGTGTDAEYVETSSGKTISFPTVKARYVRLWSNGSNVNNLNHYVEVEAYQNH